MQHHRPLFFNNAVNVKQANLISVNKRWQLRYILPLLHATMMLQNVHCAMLVSTCLVRKISVLKPLLAIAGHLILSNRLYFYL